MALQGEFVESKSSGNTMQCDSSAPYQGEAEVGVGQQKPVPTHAMHGTILAVDQLASSGPPHGRLLKPMHSP